MGNWYTLLLVLVALLIMVCLLEIEGAPGALFVRGRYPTRALSGARCITTLQEVEGATSALLVR